MPSPIKPSEFGEAIPSANADFCDRFTKWLAVPQKLRDLFSWMFDENGVPSAAFQAEVATYSAPTGTVIYCLTQNVGDGWLLMDGRAVSRTTYAALFSAIGTRYGAGDGSTTFNLPDGRGRSLIGAGTSAANAAFAQPALSTRDINTPYVGEEGHELTGDENGPHQHLSGWFARLGLTPNNTSAILRDQDDKTLSLYGSEASEVGSGATLQGVDNTGDRSEIYGSESGLGAAHNTVHPCLVGFPFVKT